MRLLCVILAGLALLPLGCASAIAEKGLSLREFNTREQVHQEFGEPVSPGPSESPVFEEFRTRRKIADDFGAKSMLMFAVMTVGLSEFAMLPVELCHNGVRLVAGQTIRFEYHPSGKVKRAYPKYGYPALHAIYTQEDWNPEAEK